MASSSSITKWRGWLLFFSVLLLNGEMPQGVEAAIIAALEGPADGQEVAGIGIVRGWAFSDTAGVQITQVALLIDGTAVTGIPCCTERADVAAAFPQFPAANTRNSGFGLTQNYNLNTPGPHTIGVKIKDSSGAQRAFTSAVMVVKAGGFEFLDLVDLSAANAQRQGQDLVLSGVRIRDKASQQARRIAARLRWFRNLQGLGLVEATTLSAASSEGSIREAVRAAQGSTVSSLKANLESPGTGQTVSGIAIIRGWAFTGQGRSIRKVQLLIDGVSSSTLPCCTERADVAAAFPGEPNARNSGFGATFNYGLLSAGVHTLAVQIEDSAGASRTLTKGVLVKRPGEFEFLDQLDFRDATVRIAGGALVVEGARAVDKVTLRTATRILRYRWNISAQAFALAEESVEDVPITNLNCTINGDVSSVSALKSDPGPDGISVAEAIQAVNNTQNSGSVFAPFLNPGTVLCTNPLPRITRGNITIAGDVDGDGAPDVTLDGSKVIVTASNTTIRSLALVNSDFPVSVAALPGTSVSNVAVLGIEVALQSEESGITVGVLPGAVGEAHLSDVLISGNRINGKTSDAVNGIFVLASRGGSSTIGGLTLRGVTIAENVIRGVGNSSVSVAVLEVRSAVLTQMTIASNTLSSTGVGVSLVVAGSKSDPLLGSENMVDVLVADNVVTDSKIDGISLEGGFQNASGNLVMGEICGNEVKNSRFFDIDLDGGLSASKNMVDALVADNVVAGSAVGIFVAAGTTRPQGDNEAPALSNMATGMILRNTVQGSSLDGIAVFGGFDDSRGPVVGNLAKQAIISNIADGILCADGIAGNRAECTSSGNAGVSDTMTAQEGSSQPEEQSSGAVQTPPPYVLPLMERLTARAEELRNRAQTETNARVQAELLRIADRLDTMKDRVAARASEQ